MKMPLRPLVLLTAALLQTASAARTHLRLQARETGMTGLHMTIRSMVGQMMESEGSSKGPGMKDIMRMATGRMDLGEAVKQLDGRLPADIAALVRVGTKHGVHTNPQYDDDSLQKARTYLNGMMYAGWEELDNVVFECMDFRKRNRGTYDQVVLDLSRLGAQISSLEGKKGHAIAGISQQNSLHADTTALLASATEEYTNTLNDNEAEMQTRKNDLAVFDFMLNLTSCNYVVPSGGALLQSHATAPKMQVCDGTLRFADQKLQARMESMMTPAARQALRAILGETMGKVGKVSLLQEGSSRGKDDALPATLPVSEEPHPEGQWKKCVDGPMACGMLHDLMSLEWGKFRDSFDELTAEMNKNEDEYNTLSANLNDQLRVITDATTEHTENLAECTSALNDDNEEKRQKEGQERTLSEEFDRKCAEFKAKISEILHTKICAVRKVRNQLMTWSQLTPLSAISDCDFGDWESKTGQCIHEKGNVITCDDSCHVNKPFHQYDPNQCGGKETMKRDVVVSPNENGMQCPPLERERRCGQHLCPVNCVMSQWSGWGHCSKDCESGIESRTRSVLTKPKNGGKRCEGPPVESQACNTGSCDRRCELAEWSDWSPCSKACDSGFTQSHKKVLIPIRGNGACPAEDNDDRLRTAWCNTQACNGDEICTAKQDLIICLDASGSVREEGFNILREFTVNLTKRYTPKFFGADTVRIGLVLFGNGQLLAGPQGTTTISPATEISALTGEFDVLRTEVWGSTYQRGFTNMAQALSLADVLLQQGGREEAQSAVLVLSDGKYSFKYQTAEKVQELKDKNIQLYMSPVIEYEGQDLEVLKEWASQPWQTNYQQIPGLQVLKYNQDMYIQKLVVKFCPDSTSPSLLEATDAERDFMMIREGAYPVDECAPWWWLGYGHTLQQCADTAKTRWKFSFAYDPKWGGCYMEGISVNQGEWDTWLVDRVDPDPCQDHGGWDPNQYFDTYVLNPRIYNIYR